MIRTLPVEDPAGNTFDALQLPHALTEDSTRLDHAWYTLDYLLAAQWCKGTLGENVDTRDIHYRYIEFTNCFGYTHSASDDHWILRDSEGFFFAFANSFFQENYTLKENQTL